MPSHEALTGPRPGPSAPPTPERSQGSGLPGAPEPEELALRSRWTEEHPDGGSHRDAMLARLAGLREGGDDGPHILDLRGLNLAETDLSGLDLTGSDFSGAELSRANLAGCTLLKTRFTRAVLFGACLADAELSGSDLRDANLQGADAQRAGFGLCDLSGACLVQANLQGATLTQANLSGADLKMAHLDDARCRDADLTGADLSKTILVDAVLTGCSVAGASFHGTDARRASLGGVSGYERASWIQADVRDVDFNHAHLCRRFILDQNYLEEFKNQSRATRIVYWIWWATSDCGRSLVRWGVLTLTIAVLFSLVYTQVNVDYGGHATALSPFYYSVVTLTTLGYGDVLPASVPAQVACMVEVVLGYVMLGGLLSIFSNKMARRAE